MVSQNTFAWSLLYNDVIKQYNNTYQSTIRMTPEEAKKSTTVSIQGGPSKEKALELANASMAIAAIRTNIEKRAKIDQNNRTNGKEIHVFSPGDVVLVAIRARYRRKTDMRFCRKAVIKEMITEVRAKIQWLETGGELQAEIPYSLAKNEWPTSLLKAFQYGFDKYVSSHETSPETSGNELADKDDDNDQFNSAVEDEQSSQNDIPVSPSRTPIRKRTRKLSDQINSESKKQKQN